MSKSVWEMSNKEIGDRGEEIAASLMERIGMEILERNWRDPSAAEADIIARDGDNIVFIEVKTRRGDTFGEPEEAITPKKQKQYKKLAKQYLKEHPEEEHMVRFDAVSILIHGESHAFLRHIRSAFEIDDVA